jgi:hypothetical protein
MADSLFGWAIDQNISKQGNCKISLRALNYLNFEPPHIKDKQLRLCNLNI